MTEPTGFILGFDPGGNRKFGWCVCHTELGDLKLIATGLADDAVDALTEVTQALRLCGLPKETDVLAAGIDAPMFWSPTGARKIDEHLRSVLKATHFETPSGTVQQINSLWGACLVQGVLLGKHLRDKWDLRITESHPKVLDHLLTHTGQSEIKGMVDNLALGLDDPGRHKRDAILSAATAWAMVHRLPGWRDLYADEPDPIQPFDTPVSYWMPIL